MALKIDQIVDQKGNSFDIDLPRDATPAIVSLDADNYIYSSILRMPKMAMNVAHFNTTGTPVETVVEVIPPDKKQVTAFNDQTSLLPYVYHLLLCLLLIVFSVSALR